MWARKEKKNGKRKTERESEKMKEQQKEKIVFHLTYFVFDVCVYVVNMCPMRYSIESKSACNSYQNPIKLYSHQSFIFDHCDWHCRILQLKNKMMDGVTDGNLISAAWLPACVSRFSRGFSYLFCYFARLVSSDWAILFW